MDFQLSVGQQEREWEQDIQEKSYFVKREQEHDKANKRSIVGKSWTQFNFQLRVKQRRKTKGEYVNYIGGSQNREFIIYQQLLKKDIFHWNTTIYIGIILKEIKIKSSTSVLSIFSESKNSCVSK